MIVVTTQRRITFTLVVASLWHWCLFYREDTYAVDSIDLLNNSGIQFSRHKEEGIDMTYFAELLTTSGIVLNEDVKFISFHRFVAATIYKYEQSEVH